MASWREEYISALKERDIREQKSYSRINEEFIDAFANLFERTSALEAEKAALQASTFITPAPGTRAKGKEPAKTASPETPWETQLRADLASALRQSGDFAARMRHAESELVELRKTTKLDKRLISSLEKSNASLQQKAKDRHEESKGKDRLVSETQDEMIGLELQLNVSEEKGRKLAMENRELIERWMERKGKEAEEMNGRLE
ncbi:autophagy-related protein 16 [Calycina marina]|uniref:Autophagy-related protein 16 n=1 Tax=Calycina marina TaxID=1763456 RepID=A0A9P7Z0H0_9HELO|nr:autophagy-related protein 16 [Calycina marina]